VVPPLDPEQAATLFVERAQAVRPEFRLTAENAPAVAEIAARLDGLPLAIELAATRTKVLTPTQILPRLQRRLSLLTTGARTLPDRQRTLRGAIAWSHDLLPEAERRLFARLSVFAGGWTLESAEAVCDPEGLGLDVLDRLASLVDQSLMLRTEPTAGRPRFSMLETIREFGQERLADDGDLEWVRRRHAEHLLDLAIAAEPHLTGADQGEWLDRCDTEQANLRAALRWATDAAERDFEGAFRLFEESLELFRRAGDEAGVARADWMIVIRDLVAGRWDGPLAKAEEAVATWRRTGERFRLGDGLVWLAVVYARAGRPADARAAMGEAMELFGEADNPMGMVSVLLGLSYLARWEERYEDAVRLGGGRGVPPRPGRRPGPPRLPGRLPRRPGGRGPGPPLPGRRRPGLGGRAAPRAWTPLARTTACR
jgi:tetratricopeptide (TPR) repeat protein